MCAAAPGVRRDRGARRAIDGAADQAAGRIAHRRHAGRAVVLQGSGLGRMERDRLPRWASRSPRTWASSWCRWRPRGATAVAAMQANQIDVMFVLDATDERKKAIDFPDAPFFWYAQGVLLKDGLKVEELDRSRPRRHADRRDAGHRARPRADQAPDRRPRSSASPTWTRRSPRSIPGASTRRRSITRRS